MIDITGLREDKRPQSSTIVHALLDRLEAAESEAIEQARLNGMGSERELALMAKLEAAEKTNREWLRANAPEGWINNLRVENEALRAEVIRIKEVEFPRKAQAVADGWRGKCERLEAKIEQMEKQAPAYWGPKHAIEGGSTTVIVGKFPVNPTDAPLYSIPGAQNATGIPEGWKLMPIEPTKEIYECFSAYDGTSYSNPFDFDEFKEEYKSAIAAAPEAKP